MAIPRSRTELSDILNFGIDQKNRILYFGLIEQETNSTNDFNHGSVEIAARAIHTMILDAPHKPISIYMNSYGGNPDSMLYLMDLILCSPCQFKFYGAGTIMSSATWIMAVCDERYLYPNAKIMIHAGEFETSGKYDDVLIEMEEEKRTMDFLLDIYAENSFMPKQFWRDVCKRDSYLSSHETVQLGLADSVIKTRKRGALRKKRNLHLSNPPAENIMRNLSRKIYGRIGVNPKYKELTINMPPKNDVEQDVFIDSEPMEKINE